MNLPLMPFALAMASSPAPTATFCGGIAWVVVVIAFEVNHLSAETAEVENRFG